MVPEENSINNRDAAREYLVDEKYSIKDLVDIERLRAIFEEFSGITGGSIGFVSHPDQEVLIATGWRAVCTRFHRMHPKTTKRCIDSNIALTGKLTKPGDINIEECENGLIDGGIPIFIKDKHVATLFAGQVFFRPPDMARFKKQAEECRYDVGKYLEAIKEVPVVTEASFKQTLSLLSRIAVLITELGYNNLESKTKTAALQDELVYHEKAEAKIFHLNAILRAISKISQLIIKEKDKTDLLDKICGMILESRDYRFVWIGLIEKETFELSPAAYAGFEDGYLRNLHTTWDDSPTGQGPAGLAIKSGQSSIVNDVAIDNRVEIWRDEMLRRDYNSMISVPIMLDDDIYGVINVYSELRNAFDEQDVTLLEELAGDIGYALHAMEAEEGRKASEEALAISEENYRSIFGAANDAIFTIDIETGEIIDVNRKACEMYLYTEEEILHLKFIDISLGDAPYAYEDAANVINKAAAGEPQIFEWMAKDKAQRLFWVEINLKRAVIGGKYRILAIVRDITERKQTEERWEKIHEAFLSFGPDADANINRLTALGGELMNADCALYNRREGQTLRSCGQWNAPEGFQAIDSAAGHICSDVIDNASDTVVVLKDLQNTDYAMTDPNVKKYNLKTYVGRAIRIGGEYSGTLCMVYQHDFEPSHEDKEIISFIALAISVEEERKSAEEISHIAQFSMDRASDMISWMGADATVRYVNDAICKNLGYSRDELLHMTVFDIDTEFSPDTWDERWKELKERRIMTIESTMRRKDGSSFPIEVTINFMEFQGEEYEFVYARDITERKAQEENLMRRDYQLEILSRTSQHINAVLEVSTILRTLTAASIELVDASAGTAGVFIDDTLSFKEYAKLGKVEPLNYVFRPGEGICGHITKTLKTYISNDVPHDPHVSEELKKKFDLQTMVDVPILNYDGKLLGCLELHNKKDGKPFDAQDVFMLQGLAAGAAVALENANILAQRNKAQNALAWQKTYYENLLNEANVWIEVIDKEARTLLWNKKAEEISGYNRDDLIGNLRKWELEYPNPKQRARLIGFVKKLIASGKTVKGLEIAVMTHGGQEKTISWSSTIIRDSYGKVIGSMFIGNDVTERKTIEKEREALTKELTKSNKRLGELALKDLQTGLHNHHYLTEVIEPELYRAKRYIHPLSVIMIDVDYFRSVNDLYGHEFGDMVLKQFATQLKKMVRRYDVLVRFGGEEFVILSSGADREKALALSHRLQEALSLYNFGDKKHAVKLRMSMAVASYPDDPIETGMDLINLAEKILDKVKEAGGNKVYSSIDTKNGKRPASEAEPTDIQYLRKKISRLTKRGKQSLMESIFAFAKTIELRDHYTGEHADSTVQYATQIARALKLKQDEIDRVRQAAILHDLGKVGISDSILLKKAKLTKKEFAEIKKHPQIGADIIRPIHFMQEIIPLILYHHEKWDGSGYPTGIKGEVIPIGARIISIADVFQALTSDRPYRRAFSKRDAMEILRANAGKQFDPYIVKTFLKILKNEKDRRRPAIQAASKNKKGKQ